MQITLPTGTVPWDVFGGVVGGIIAGIIAIWLAHLDRRNQIRVAALDKRLEAHQGAYTLWRRLIFDSGDSERAGDTVIECQNWWDKHCLYLTPEARKAFQQAYVAAGSRVALLATKDVDAMGRNWEVIKRAGPIIADGVMQSLGDKEAEVVKDPRIMHDQSH